MFGVPGQQGNYFVDRPIRKLIGGLQRLPYNSATAKVIHKLLNYVQDGPIKTRDGFLIDFKKTGVYPTGLRKLVISGSYEREYFEMIRRLVNLGDYVADVGAHEGYVTLLMSKAVGGEGVCDRA